MPDEKCTHLFTMPEIPLHLRRGWRKMWVYSPPRRDLWHDDASYIAYQSYDPPEPETMRGHALATIVTADYCPGRPHVDGCPDMPAWDDVPF